jgi:hypothetical protein
VCGWSTPRPGRFTPWKETRYPFYRRMGGPQDRCGRVRKMSPPSAFDPRIVQPLANRYTDCAITAHSTLVHTSKLQISIILETTVDKRSSVLNNAHRCFVWSSWFCLQNLRNFYDTQIVRVESAYVSRLTNIFDKAMFQVEWDPVYAA